MNIMMIIAFLLLTGIAFLLYLFYRTNLPESMLLACCVVILTLNVTAHIRLIMLGMILLVLFGLIGLILFGFNYVFIKNKDGTRKKVDGLYAYIALGVIFCLSMILYQGDFIQHIDELHLWAYVPRYMIMYGTLPKRGIPLYIEQNLGTCYFNYFFQRIGGYNEGMMYVSATLLAWIGFLLPMGHIKKDHKVLTLYVLILYISLFSFYLYGNKNLYVDVPLAAWAGGLLAWIVVNHNRKKLMKIIIPASIVLLDIKRSTGWLLVIFVIVFTLVQWFFLSEKTAKFSKKTFYIIMLGFDILFLITVRNFYGLLKDDSKYRFFPSFFRSFLERKGINADKTTLTLMTFLRKSMFSSLTLGKSSFNVTYISALIIIIGLILMSRNKERLAYLTFILSMILVYTTAVYMGFLFRFSYEMSIKARSSCRYLSILIILLFAFVLILFLQNHEFGKAEYCITFALIFLFGTGLNQGAVGNLTSFDKENVTGYLDVKTVREEADIIRDLIGDEDKVYFISQAGDEEDEFAVNAALYYLDKHMYNHMHNAWKFNENGSVMGIVQHGSPTIENLPDILKDGKYTYVWVYKADEYFKERMPDLFQMDKTEEICDGQLYKIKFGKSRCKLNLVKNMITYDDRRLYENQK